MSEYKICPNGHYYTGEHCPYCPKTYVSISEVEADHELAKRMMTIPLCKHCGRPLRIGIPHPQYGVVVSSLQDIRDHIVPWNYQWDGKCENCGHDYNINMGLNMGSHGKDNRSKQTTIRVTSRGYCHDFESSIDDFSPATQLSGVEIHTKTDSQDEYVFLSANELKYIINALRDSPVIRQFDYQEEYSEEYRRRT